MTAATKLASLIAQIAPPLEIYVPFLVEKLRGYVQLFEEMDKNDGWLPYPEEVADLFKRLKVTHWAELYFEKGVSNFLNAHKPEIGAGLAAFAKHHANTSAEEATRLLTTFLMNPSLRGSMNSVDELFDIPGLETLFGAPEPASAESADAELRDQERYGWLIHLVTFYNDLSLATHGELLTELVARAVVEDDDDALVKAVQIDRSLLPYFQDRLSDKSMRGDSTFFGSLAYRVNNPPRRGENKHPLLWIFFLDLHRLGYLNRALGSRRLLNYYQEAIGKNEKYSITDELVVQRQRRKFLKKYRQPK